MTWRDDVREDLGRHSAADQPLLSRRGRSSAALLVAGHPGLWAVLHYRLSHPLGAVGCPGAEHGAVEGG